MMRLDTTRRIGINKASSYLCCINRICQRFALVERLEESIEALGRVNHSLSRFDMGRYTSSWPLFAGGFGPTVRASSSPAASSSFCGATILTFFADGFDAGYHVLVTVNNFLHIPHTWEESLVGLVLLSVATGSTDLVRVEGAMDFCFSSFCVRKY